MYFLNARNEKRTLLAPSLVFINYKKKKEKRFVESRNLVCKDFQKFHILKTEF